MNGLQIPIIKLTVDYMQTAILQALAPEQLSQQLEAAAKQALAEIDFKRMIQREIINITEMMIQDTDLMEPIKDRISESLDKAVNSLLKEAPDETNAT